MNKTVQCWDGSILELNQMVYNGNRGERKRFIVTMQTRGTWTRDA